MLPLEEIKDLLYKSDLKKIAQDTELHFNTLYKLANGLNDNPTYKTLKTLSQYFLGETKESEFPF